MSLRPLALLLPVFLATPLEAAAQTELKIDGFSAGMPVGFQAGFVADEVAAVRLDPPTAGVQLQSVRFLWGGASEMSTVTVWIWDDSAGATQPGTLLMPGEAYGVMADDETMHEVDLTSKNIILNGPFRVGIGITLDGLPGPARDADGTIDANRNFILATGFGWVRSADLGLSGDWVIRAVVSGAVTPTDGGVTPDSGLTPDGGFPPDSGSPPDGGFPPDSGDTPDAGVIVDSGVPVEDAGTTPTDAGVEASCLGNAECPSGSYCGSNKVCTFDCRSDDDCSAGTCNSLGQCIDRTETSGSGCSVTGRQPLGAWLLLASVLFIHRRRKRER
ncbi:MAG: hypothetical protein KC933_00865 [Myxococcales bacterium]|nr:hypothetical protein [Myxococcales bacterium]MCB9650184.1 hypothetical protein [Deltaproteobacteria bacterium]